MSVGRASLLIVVLTALSRVLGFVREAVYASVFGASADLDAFLVAQGLPNIVVTLIASAVVTSSIPVLSGALGRGDDTGARRTFNSLFTVVLVTLIAVAGAMALAAEQLVELTAPGFEAEQVELAARVARVLLIGAVLVGAMNLIAGLLQAHREFFWPAVLGIPFNLVMIAAAAIFGGEFGVIALAVGFVVGSAARVCFEVPGLRKIRFRPGFRLDLHDPGLRLVLGMAPLILVGNSIGNVNTFVDRLVGSLADEGTISALNYGFRLIALPHGLLALALLQAIYPSLGRAGSAGERERFRELTDRGLVMLTLVLTPFLAGSIVLAEPLVAVVYARGAFDSADVELTAQALTFYSPLILLLAWRELLARGCYALADARTPVATAALAMVVNVAGDLTLGRAYGVPGIAASTALAMAVAFGALFAILHRGGKIVGGRTFLRVCVRALAAGAVAGAVMFAVGEGVSSDGVGDLGALGIPAVAGMAAYVAVARALLPAEARLVASTIREALTSVGRRAGGPSSGRQS